MARRSLSRPRARARDQKQHLRYEALRGVELVGVSHLCAMNLFLPGARWPRSRIRRSARSMEATSSEPAPRSASFHATAVRVPASATRAPR